MVGETEKVNDKEVTEEVFVVEDFPTIFIRTMTDFIMNSNKESNQPLAVEEDLEETANMKFLAGKKKKSEAPIVVNKTDAKSSDNRVWQKTPERKRHGRNRNRGGRRSQTRNKDDYSQERRELESRLEEVDDFLERADNDTYAYERRSRRIRIDKYTPSKVEEVDDGELRLSLEALGMCEQEVEDCLEALEMCGEEGDDFLERADSDTCTYERRNRRIRIDKQQSKVKEHQMRWFENDKAELEEDISELVVTEESWENQIEAAESKLKCDADENPVKEILMNFDA